MRKLLSGNYAIAYGVKLCRVEVIAAYPITPQTSIIEQLSEFASRKETDYTIIPVESEHSAMAACIAASSAGARTFTATSSQGLALMHELLHWAGGARLPIVLANCNRALAAPWSIGSDQNDSLSQRDTGWLQFYCESCQEALDTVIQAYRISEQLLIPSMINIEGFILSHVLEPVDIPQTKLVDQFLPGFEPEHKLDVDNPCAFGGGTVGVTQDLYINFRYKLHEDMEGAIAVAKQVDDEFAEVFGRTYGLVEPYCLEDADIVLVTSGTISSTARVVVDEHRTKGVRVGALKVRVFRPFPYDEVRKWLRQAQKVAVIDRNISLGDSGIFALQVKASLFELDERPAVFGFIAGLGGKDVAPNTISKIIHYVNDHEVAEDRTIWMGILP